MNCKSCAAIKTERLDWLSENPFYTRRFYLHVGRKCRKMSIKDVAEELHLDWHCVKELDKLYMAEQLRRYPARAPEVIGIDEISAGPRGAYRIVVSDVLRRRCIWYGGTDRSEKSMDEFYAWLGAEKAAGVRLAVMDMWRAYQKSTRRNAPNAAILFDKFHVVSHLSEALDEVRKQEYSRLSGSDRSFIKGQKYTLLSNRENLTLGGRKALIKLLGANKRLNIAYLLKETFARLWSFKSETWARKFFDNWKASLRWQRIKPYEKFARMIDAHWDGIACYCRPENRVPLGYVEGFNNKIRSIQRRAFGLRDEAYFKLKILTCMLPRV